jgi:hypothetical protein
LLDTTWNTEFWFWLFCNIEAPPADRRSHIESDQFLPRLVDGETGADLEKENVSVFPNGCVATADEAVDTRPVTSKTSAARERFTAFGRIF